MFFIFLHLQSYDAIADDVLHQAQLTLHFQRQTFLFMFVQYKFCNDSRLLQIFLDLHGPHSGVALVQFVALFVIIRNGDGFIMVVFSNCAYYKVLESL